MAVCAVVGRAVVGYAVVGRLAAVGHSVGGRLAARRWPADSVAVGHPMACRSAACFAAS